MDAPPLPLKNTFPKEFSFQLIVHIHRKDIGDHIYANKKIIIIIISKAKKKKPSEDHYSQKNNNVGIFFYLILENKNKKGRNEIASSKFVTSYNLERDKQFSLV